MDKFWDMTMDFLGKINAWIPLVAVLFAGAGLVAVVLILAVTGCALRKRLVPQWLIWTYFIFATMVIFAHDGNDLATVVADMEIPCLVVLLCYLFRLFFYRRPRYTYVEHTVYQRAVAKGRVVAEKTTDEENQDTTSEPVDNADDTDIDTDNGANEKDKAKDEALAISRKEQRKAEKAAREYERAAREAERVAREAEEKAAAEKERAEREIAAAKQAAEAKAAAEVEAAEKAAREAEAKAAAEKEKAAAEKERAAREIAAARKAAAEKVAQNNAKTTTTTSTFALPVVEPIPDKTYVATSEPTITVTPVSETMPELKMPNTNIQLRYNTSSTTRSTSPRPVTTGTTRTATVSSLTTRPTTTTTTTVSPNRTVTTETTTTPLNAYTAMYNPRVVKTTTTTTTTTTNTNSNTLNAVSATRTVNGTTTGAAAIKATSTSSTSSTPRSTEDIMAAIERLRANMKK